MYPGAEVKVRPDQPAVIMAAGGEVITYAELERRSNRLAHWLRRQGLSRLDHYSIFMENHARYIECCSAGERSGLYYTCINSYLQPDEVAYLLENSRSQVLITSMAKLEVAKKAVELTPAIKVCLIVDGPGDGGRFLNLDEAVGEPAGHADRRRGARARRCSTRRAPPGGRRASSGRCRTCRRRAAWRSSTFSTKLWRYRPEMVYLSPAPLYHSAPQAAISLDHPRRRHRGDHGALRRRAVPGAGREAPGDAQPAGADDVLAHAEAAGGRAAPLRPLLARDGDPRRRAVPACRSSAR